LYLAERWYLAGGSRESTRTEVDTPPLFNRALDPPQEWADTASGQINWSDCHSAESPEGAPPCSKNRPWAMLDETGAQTGTRKGS